MVTGFSFCLNTPYLCNFCVIPLLTDIGRIYHMSEGFSLWLVVRGRARELPCGFVICGKRLPYLQLDRTPKA